MTEIKIDLFLSLRGEKKHLDCAFFTGICSASIFWPAFQSRAATTAGSCTKPWRFCSKSARLAFTFFFGGGCFNEILRYLKVDGNILSILNLKDVFSSKAWYNCEILI